MNKSVILDSSAIISLTFSDDSNHKRAIDISKNLNQENSVLVLPGEIITETLNVIGKKIGKEKQLLVGKDLLESSEYIIFETDEQVRQNAFIKLHNTANTVSYTDCIVMAIADYFNSSYIFGFDHAFVTNGYTLVY